MGSVAIGQQLRSPAGMTSPNQFPRRGNGPGVQRRWKVAPATARFPPRQWEAKRERVGRESALNAASPSPPEEVTSYTHAMMLRP